jgi:hypothetical protein
MDTQKPSNLLTSMIDYHIYLQEKLNTADHAPKVDYIEFSVAKYRFLIEISFVEHVINWQTPYKMPFLPEYALGVIHEQQKSMVLVSLEKWLFGENLHHEQYPLILCCAYQNFKIAFAVSQAAFYFHDQSINDIYLNCDYTSIHKYLETQKEIQKDAQQKIQAGLSPIEIESRSELWVINESWFKAYLRF